MFMEFVLAKQQAVTRKWEGFKLKYAREYMHLEYEPNG